MAPRLQTRPDAEARGPHARTTPLPLSELFDAFVDRRAPVAFRAYDGSSRDRADAVGLIEIRRARALRHLVAAPGQLGLARGYVMGDIEIHGDLHATLHGLVAHRREHPAWGRVLAGLRPWMLRRPPIPSAEARAPWRRGLRRHTKDRDARAISHHYDLSNRFYELVLGPSMAYSCAVFSAPSATLDEAQGEKFDLICRKLDLRPGERLLDVGAGWGGLVRHAAEHYGARALGVTISRAQAGWAQRAILAAGLQHRAEVRPLDYRDVRETHFDAIASVGTMEHIGSRELGPHFGAMAERLRPEGKMLNHAITRATNHARHRAGAFVDRYVFPDGELQSPATVIAAIHDHGLEIRHEENLREHYAMTLRAWGENLERNWGEAVGEVGEVRARAWRLYMAISRVGFDLNRLQIHQTLGARVGPGGRSGTPPRPSWPRIGSPAPAVRGGELPRPAGEERVALA